MQYSLCSTVLALNQVQQRPSIRERDITTALWLACLANPDLTIHKSPHAF